MSKFQVYGQRKTQYLVSCFILHQGHWITQFFICFVFSLLHFAASKISSLCACQYFQMWWRNLTVIEKFSFLLHINFPMVLNDQKLWYFIKNKISQIMTHSSKWIRSKRSEIHTNNSLIIHCSFVMSKYIYNIYYIYIYTKNKKHSKIK